MACKLFSQLTVNARKSFIKSFWNSDLKKLHTNVSVKEIQIPLKCGIVAGKLWGNEHEQPILALHGWQDNAGTWDTLAPLLCNIRPILAIDFLGHGHSSWIPEGMQYHPWDIPLLILLIKKYFKWHKVSLLAHSMGAIASLRFACVFPDDVDFYIAIENLIVGDLDLEIQIQKIPKAFNKVDEIKKEPPIYTMKEMIQMWHLGSSNSVSIESVPHLLNRTTKASKVLNYYYFTHDPRLKYLIYSVEKKQFVEKLITRLKCPTLYIKGINSPYAIDKETVAMREIIANNNSNYESYFLPGTHHLHLNNPESVLPCILKFLRKHKFIEKDSIPSMLM